MSDRLMVCTRKGWFDFRKGASGWSVAQRAHISIPVSIAMRDPRDGAIFAALEHGHYGAKLMKSSDDGQLGRSWTRLLMLVRRVISPCSRFGPWHLPAAINPA